MYLSYANREQINVAVGDLVSIQGNEGIVTEVKHGKAYHHNNKMYVDVRVSFTGELKDTSYNNEWFGLFYVIRKGKI